MRPDESPTVDPLAAREHAAASLEAAIVALGVAYRDYARRTAALDARLHADLARPLELPIALHLARAGLGAFLERKLQDTPASLRTIVESQHARLREPPT
jgi:hypothetical protein